MHSYFKTIKITLLITLALSIHLEPVAAQSRTSVAKVVSFDMGGPIKSRRDEIRKLQRLGHRVEIRGQCFSACTMYLGLPNVCVYPDAVLGFHGPKAMAGTLPTDVFDHWSNVMARNLRKPLQTWFMQRARYVKSGVLRVSGATLINMGYARCETPI